MDDGRHEALNVAAVKDGLFLLGRMLMRVHRKHIGNARQIFRPLVERDRRQIENSNLVGLEIFCRPRQIHGGLQSGLFHRQTVLVFVGVLFREGQEHDVVRIRDGRVIGGGAAHVDEASRPHCELVGFQHRDIFKRAGAAVADQTARVEGAGEVRAADAIARFQNIEHADNPAGLAGAGEVNLNAFEE